MEGFSILTTISHPKINHHNRRCTTPLAMPFQALFICNLKLAKRTEHRKLEKKDGTSVPTVARPTQFQHFQILARRFRTTSRSLPLRTRWDLKQKLYFRLRYYVSVWNFFLLVWLLKFKASGVQPIAPPQSEVVAGTKLIQRSEATLSFSLLFLQLISGIPTRGRRS